MPSAIISQVPLWVAPLFIGLLFLGLRATKQRKIPLAISYSLPLLALISLQSLAQLPDQLFVWSAYALAYMGGLTIGYRLQARWIIAKQSPFVEVDAEWLTLITMMMIFWLSFAVGITRAVAPDLLTNIAVEVALAGVLSFAGGSFAGRALRILRS